MIVPVVCSRFIVMILTIVFTMLVSWIQAIILTLYAVWDSSIIIITKIPLLVNAAILFVILPEVSYRLNLYKFSFLRLAKFSRLRFALIPSFLVLIIFLLNLSIALGSSVLTVSALLRGIIMTIILRELRGCILPVTIVSKLEIVPGEVRVRDKCLNHAVI